MDIHWHVIEVLTTFQSVNISVKYLGKQIGA